VFRDGRAVALIDFDLCAWTTRSIDLANTAMHWVPLCDPADRGPALREVDPGGRLRALLDGYGRDAVAADALLAACELRFADSYAAMEWAADYYGGGWDRMWHQGVGEVIRRRIAWFAAAIPKLTSALG
jgi:aminoglycoside phosphotransferase (APT) family kinase protein